MAEINATLVMGLFERITGEQRDELYADLVNRSVAKVNRMLRVDTLTSEQEGRCEYAAAAEAVYQYALEGASCQSFVMSENGAVKKGAVSPVTIANADALRKYAFGEIADVADTGGFVFETTEG
ncbi:MAG: hypothetical protein IKN17_12435 [Ruminococcus sp.]|nr:hypothetical protein [Ruminococcus sp.]